MHNAAIYLLSSRTTLLEKCLTCLYENWNHKFGYPIHVHYFDDIYSQEQINRIRCQVSENIYFHQVGYQIPSHVKREELFFNRNEIAYSRKRFSEARLGYLHMLRFKSQLVPFGLFGGPSKELSKYRYLMRIDDDSWFKSPIKYDLFDYLEKHSFATGYTWNQVNRNTVDTRVKLWDFFKEYLKCSGYVPVNAQLRRAYETDNESLMHSLKFAAGNLNLYDMHAFKRAPWSEYQNALFRVSGDYKYRWGDCETESLFAYTHFDTGVFDLRLRSSGLYSDCLPEAKGNYAPSVDSGGVSVGDSIVSWDENAGFCFAVVHMMRRRLRLWMVKLLSYIGLVLERQKRR